MRMGNCGQCILGFGCRLCHLAGHVYIVYVCVSIQSVGVVRLLAAFGQAVVAASTLCVGLE